MKKKPRPLFGGNDSGATFSPDRKYRYKLWRTWSDDPKRIAFIGLNPSIADELDNDRTLGRCIGFAKSIGAGGMVMLNLFAYVSTDRAAMKRYGKPIGPDNDTTLRIESKACDLVIACWGTDGVHLGRDAAVYKLLTAAGVELQCLKLTKDGHPWHPLYLNGELKPQLWLPNQKDEL